MGHHFYELVNVPKFKRFHICCLNLIFQLVGTKDNATEEQDTAETVTTAADLQPLLKVNNMLEVFGQIIAHVNSGKWSRA